MRIEPPTPLPAQELGVFIKRAHEQEQAHPHKSSEQSKPRVEFSRQKASGRVPDKSVSRKSTLKRESHRVPLIVTSFPSTSGTVPFKEVPETSRSSRLLSIASSEGKVPLMAGLFAKRIE